MNHPTRHLNTRSYGPVLYPVGIPSHSNSAPSLSTPSTALILGGTAAVLGGWPLVFGVAGLSLLGIMSDLAAPRPRLTIGEEHAASVALAMDEGDVGEENAGELATAIGNGKESAGLENDDSSLGDERY